MTKLFWRKLCLLAIDMGAVLGTGLLVSCLYHWIHPVTSYGSWIGNLGLLVFIYFVGMMFSRLYNTLWRYAGAAEFLYCAVVTLGSGVVYLAASAFSFHSMPMVFYLLVVLMITVEILLVRMSYRYLRSWRDEKTKKENTDMRKRTLIVGAGVSADFLLKDTLQNPQNVYNPVCIVDDNLEKVGRVFQGILIAGTVDDIPRLCEKREIEAILICTPSATEAEKHRIYETCVSTKCKTYLIPDMTALIQEQQPLVQRMREIDINDLLGRESRVLDNQAAKETFGGKVIMVTGAGGSIGSELARQIAKLNPTKLILLDIYENTLYDIQQELRFQYGNSLDMQAEVASIRDREKLEQIYQKYHPNIVFHAAAHKHVPLMENAPEEAVKNNIFGTKNVAELALKYNVERFLLISTDKAVNPTNVMGATKRFTEMLIQNLNKQGDTRFVAVRFGNVIGSNGSVIPLFKKQLAQGGPLTVTHKDIIRYFMTIPEAVSLVLESASMAKGGELFILNMGEPVRIMDVAEKMIRLSGFEPYKDIDIKIVGLRPGEKLYEELCMSEEGTVATSNSEIFIATIQAITEQQMEKSLRLLQQALDMKDEEHLVVALQHAVPTYHPQMEYHHKDDKAVKHVTA